MFLKLATGIREQNIKAAESGEFLLDRAGRNMGRLR
jgi:hypothetical protein